MVLVEELCTILVKSLEKAGVSALVIEDKIGLKKIHCSKSKKIQNKILLKIFVRRSKSKGVKFSDDFYCIARSKALFLKRFG